jgi:TolB-like protein
LLTSLALVLGVTAAAVYLWTSNRSNSPEAIRDVKRIAVLPFKNLSADPANDYFSDGMTDTLITALSRIKGVTIISRGSVFSFKGKEVDPHEVGRELGVASVVEGGVRMDGDSVRVTVRLVNVEHGSVLWVGEPYARPQRDVFALQDEIARSVAAGLKITLTGEEEQHLAKVYTKNVDAYRFYLMGRACWNKRTEEQINQGIGYFEKAVGLDPNFALAYAGLADSYALLNFYGSVKQAEAFPKAKAAAEKALAIDDTLAETHTTLAYVKYTYEWDWEGAEREFNRAIELDPNYSTARHWYSEYLTCKRAIP